MAQVKGCGLWPRGGKGEWPKAQVRGSGQGPGREEWPMAR